MSCNTRNPKPPCPSGKEPRTRILPSGKTETCCYVSYPKKEKPSCNTRNPKPPCPPGKEPSTRALPSGKTETCCYVSYPKKQQKPIYEKQIDKKPIYEKQIEKTSTFKKLKKTKRKQILKRLFTKKEFSHAKKLIQRLKYSYPLGKINENATNRAINLNGIEIPNDEISPTRSTSPYSTSHSSPRQKPVDMRDYRYYDNPLFDVRIDKREKKTPLSVRHPEKLKRIASGSFNTVYYYKDKAWRINSQPMFDFFEVDNAYNEGLLTIRLSGLNISPKIYDYYFARDKYSYDSIYCIQVSEFSEYGSLSNFMCTSKFKGDIVETMAKETISLYKRMCENEVFCIDVKTGNMIVTNDMSVRIIDFDTEFCGSKESEKNRNLETFYKELRVNFTDIQKPNIKNGFLTFNLLQVATMCKNSSNSREYNKFAELLIENMTESDLVDAEKVALLNVGGKRTIDTLLWYTNKDKSIIKEKKLNYFHLTDKTWVSFKLQTVLHVLYVYIKYGIKETNRLIFEYNKPLLEIYNNKNNKNVKMSINMRSGDRHILYDVDSKKSHKPPVGFTPKFKV